MARKIGGMQAELAGKRQAWQGQGQAMAVDSGTALIRIRAMPFGFNSARVTLEQGPTCGGHAQRDRKAATFVVRSTVRVTPPNRSWRSQEWL